MATPADATGQGIMSAGGGTTTGTRWREVDRLFQEVVELPTAHRTQFLNDNCRTPQIRAEVEELLSQDKGAEGYFDDCFANLGHGVEEAVEEGLKAGDYRIDRLIGSGGMGSVYLAHREDGEFQQRVAIKFAMGALTSRFRTERNLLARLEHPNIARLLGGGDTASGVPYLVMEYVEGKTLTHWSRENKPDKRRKLNLFLKICGAVSYAHRNLIVHRDIKPGNIMVTGDDVPKLLDFGISKLMDPSGEDGQRTGTIGMLTPAYASPEQIRGEVVTTAADVYSLGSVLYELIAGHAPYDLAKSTPAEIERAICNSDPAPPSGTRADDLDKIILKAMHKSPDRRYTSVEQLAADIRRYQNGRPVEAQNDTSWYRFRKFLTRHKAGVAIAAILFGLIAAIVVKTVNEAKRFEMLFTGLGNVARSFAVELPEVAAHKSPGEIRLEIARIYHRQVTMVVQQTSSFATSNRQMAFSYEQLAATLGYQHERADGRYADALFYLQRSMDLLEDSNGNTRHDDDRSLATLGRMHCHAGVLLDRLNRPAEAVLHYRRGLDLLQTAVGDPAPGSRFYIREFIEALGYNADTAIREKRFDDARRHLNRMLRESIKQRGQKTYSIWWEVGALLRFGRLEKRLGNPAGAHSYLEEAAALVAKSQSNSFLSQAMTVELELERGHKDRAKALLQPIIKTHGQHPRVHDLIRQCE
jgi:serine/threonine protein kinase